MSNLDKLMQMATLEQLNIMIQQMSKSTSYNEPKDVLSLPIVQKVITAYEDELKKKECVTSCNCKDYTNLLDNILYQAQLQNSRFLKIENKLDELCSLIENKSTVSEVKLKPEPESIDKNQTKLYSYPGFLHYVNIIEQENEVLEECLESQSLESQCLESQCLESQCLSQDLESQCLESQ